ncbi:hypothetical protein FHR92_000405 [Fontibacillus solani]|uniref:Uncharacterized protein n=1 Tax=Fontibacillus solani TaxID=1572857 RepID=A0A7W3SPR7_9BACL|nr:hypothetical protein [Fontibacillus solani]
MKKGKAPPLLVMIISISFVLIALAAGSMLKIYNGITC